MCFSHPSNSGVYLSESDLPERRRSTQPVETTPSVQRRGLTTPPPVAPEPEPTPARRDAPNIAHTLKKAGGLVGASGAGSSAPPMKGAGTGRMIY